MLKEEAMGDKKSAVRRKALGMLEQAQANLPFIAQHKHSCNGDPCRYGLMQSNIHPLPTSSPDSACQEAALCMWQQKQSKPAQ